MGASECGFCLGDVGLVVDVVELDKRLAGGYLLVVVHVDLFHGPGDACAQRRYVGPHVGVVGFLFGTAAFPGSPFAADGEYQHCGDGQDDDGDDDCFFRHRFTSTCQFRGVRVNLLRGWCCRAQRLKRLRENSALKQRAVP